MKTKLRTAYTDMITTEKICVRSEEDYVTKEEYDELAEEEPTFERIPVYMAMDVDKFRKELKDNVIELNNFIGNSRFKISNESLTELYAKIKELFN
jgi:hypothetical protein